MPFQRPRAGGGTDDLYIGKGNRLSSLIDDLSLYEGLVLSKQLKGLLRKAG